jgi:hypothetical protein
MAIADLLHGSPALPAERANVINDLAATSKQNKDQAFSTKDRNRGQSRLRRQFVVGNPSQSPHLNHVRASRERARSPMAL